MVYLVLERSPATASTRAPEWLWLVFPLLDAWQVRIWRLTGHGEMHEDPVAFAARPAVLGPRPAGRALRPAGLVARDGERDGRDSSWGRAHPGRQEVLRPAWSDRRRTDCRREARPRLGHGPAAPTATRR